MTLRELLMGGPGLNGYAYKADTYCVECARTIIQEQVAPFLHAIPEYLHTDTDHVPQPIFFGDTDRAVHCCHCGEYLYGTDPELGGGSEDG